MDEIDEGDMPVATDITEILQQAVECVTIYDQEYKFAVPAIAKLKLIHVLLLLFCLTHLSIVESAGIPQGLIGKQQQQLCGIMNRNMGTDREYNCWCVMDHQGHAVCSMDTAMTADRHTMRGLHIDNLTWKLNSIETDLDT